MNLYNWQQSDWPHFHYDAGCVETAAIALVEKMGTLGGKLSHLEKNLQLDALVDVLVEEAIKTSKIEGEVIAPADVRSSIINKLGLPDHKSRVKDTRAVAIAELIVNVRKTVMVPLSEEQLFDWHLNLFVNSPNPHLKVGRYRVDNEPMQIVSGNPTRLLIHYEAPPARAVPAEMEKFIRWFNDTAPGGSKVLHFAPIRAAIAHLYFESIHPFDDGNGRIGRAIAEKALAQGFAEPILLSLSQTIEAEKKAYYAALQAASRRNEITSWINYFIDVIAKAQTASEILIDFLFKRHQFSKKFLPLCNPRQQKVLERMLAAGSKGFNGGMSAKKYMIIADTSKATATRDLQQLVEMKALQSMGEGRGVRYELLMV